MVNHDQVLVGWSEIFGWHIMLNRFMQISWYVKREQVGSNVILATLQMT